MGITNESLKQLVNDIINLVTKSSKVELGLNLTSFVEDEETQASLALPKVIEETVFQLAK